MSSKDGKFGGTRVSRRQFTILCQIALLPVVWPAMKLLGFAVDRAIDHLQSSNRSLEGLFGSRDDVGVTALITTAFLRGGEDVRSRDNAATWVTTMTVTTAPHRRSGKQVANDSSIGSPPSATT